MRLHSDKPACARRGNIEATDREVETVAKPSEVAKLSGTPNRLIITCPAAGERALRANRSAQESR